MFRFEFLGGPADGGRGRALQLKDVVILPADNGLPDEECGVHKYWKTNYLNSSGAVIYVFEDLRDLREESNGKEES